MRKYLVTGILSICCLSSAVFAQEDEKNKKVVGSGNLVTRDIPVQSFDQLSASGVYSVLLTQGDKESVKIEADDNLQELFQVRNEGSKLIISMKDKISINSKKGMKVYVTFRKLKSMDLSMVGNFSSKDNLSFGDLKIKNSSVGSVDLKMTAQSLDVENSSVGSVKLDGKAENAVIRNSGVGSIKAGSFVVQTMDIENNGIGHAEVNAEKEIKVKDSMLGKVNNKGNAPVKRTNKTVI